MKNRRRAKRLILSRQTIRNLDARQTIRHLDAPALRRPVGASYFCYCDDEFLTWSICDNNYC